MKTIRKMIARALGDDALRFPASRPQVRREPLCEALEGRQLLSTAASTMASGMPAWVGRGAHGGWSGHAPTAAEIAQFHAKGGAKGNWTADFAHSGKHGSFSAPAIERDVEGRLHDASE